MDERSYNQPDGDKEPKYTECERCCGDGWVFTDHEETHRITCKECEGTGVIEIED